MKKLIFRKFAQDTLIFFTIVCSVMGLIVWTLQAVNYFDYVTQDGHGLKVYFLYTIYNFPKIIHKIVPFIFFISVFYIIINYDNRNELSIFWTNGVSKISFTNKVILLSIFLTIFQILLGSLLSPFTQYKAREFLKNSNVDFFTSLIKPGKFINAVEGLTIFIENKNDDGTYSNIFLDDTTRGGSRMIYAKNGNLIDDGKKKIFRLYDGKVIDNDEQNIENTETKKTKVNIFEFDQIDFNLADFSTNTITVPKIQELSSKHLVYCLFSKNKNNLEFKCEESLVKETKQEIFKRFYKPLYIPIIGILCCFLIIVSRNHLKYEKRKKIIFLFTFFILILSETTLRYSASSNLFSLIYLIFPWILFSIIYLFFYLRVRNV